MKGIKSQLKFSISIILVFFITSCGQSVQSQNAASLEQYKEVALRYLRALVSGDFKTYMDLDLYSKDSLERAKELVPAQPAFDREQRMQNVRNSTMSQISNSFNNIVKHGEGAYPNLAWIVSRLRGSTLKVLEVTPLKKFNITLNLPEFNNAQQADVYIEAQGRGKIVFFVPVVHQNGKWGVWSPGIQLHK